MNKKTIFVYADWQYPEPPVLMGYLHAELLRGVDWRSAAKRFDISKADQEIKAKAFENFVDLQVFS